MIWYACCLWWCWWLMSFFCCLLFYYVVKIYVACLSSVVRMFNCNCKMCFMMWGCVLKLYFDCKLQAWTWQYEQGSDLSWSGNLWLTWDTCKIEIAYSSGLEQRTSITMFSVGRVERAVRTAPAGKIADRSTRTEKVPNLWVRTTVG